MTSNTSPDDEITSPESFQTALEQLMSEAVRNDIDPRGPWEFRFDPPTPDWEVIVVELQNRDNRGAD